ncbi:MAG: TetR/AcrR family transcriptional regulator [Sphingobacteriales bacterium]|nr:MAG: TetR/AcrR family transcriptional regulator [Sphingobacteriales bacterium]
MEYSDKQLQILDVAERLFAEHGFDGASVRDIAKDADVNVAMISYYFGSKEKLLEALFIRRVSEIRLQIENTVQNNALSPMDKIYQLVDTYIERMVNRQHFHKLVVREQMLRKESPVCMQIIETKKKNQELIRSIIKDGQNQGAFKNDVDVPLMMTTMIGTANQLITTQHIYRELNNLQDMPEEIFQENLKKKLSQHLKTIFKAILTYEA